MAMDRKEFLARRLVAVSLIGLSTFGVREALTRSGDALTQGAGGAGGCQALSVAYQVDYVPEQRSYLVTGAEVTGLGPGCAGRTVQVTFSAADGSPLATADARIAASSAAVVLAGDEAVEAAKVAGVSVAVLG
ncbi:MAG: hypothetical protein ACOH2F_12645 [Cellulomonas sp.]